MKNTGNMLYNIEDLRIVMINKDYIEYAEDDNVNYFNENVRFIVEKVLINDTDSAGEPYYAEYYTECITEEDLSERYSSKPFQDTPKMFSMVSKIPNQYLTEEEKESGKISLKRVYKVLQDININHEKDNSKIKRKK